MIDPMMTVDDQQKIQRVVEGLPPDAVIVEYGSGGSTLMFARFLRETQRLITIEHNVDWFHKVKADLSAPDLASKRAEIHLRTPDADASVWPFGHHYEETPFAAADYIHATGVDIPWSDVRCVFVDGFVRGPVMAMLATKLTLGTTVMLHDYPGREAWYEWAVRLYDVVTLPEGSSADRDASGPVLPNSLLVLRSK